MISKLHSAFLQKTISLLFFGFVVLGLFTTSCKKQSAQLPANKITSVDSTEIILLDYNKKITQLEDSAILALLARQSVNYTKAKSGFWYYIQKSSDLQPVANDSEVTCSYKAFTLDDIQVMQEEDKTIQFGRKEVISGLEEGLKVMKRGETARFIVPWYLAYGAQGNERIKPYSTLIFVVETKE